MGNPAWGHGYHEGFNDGAKRGSLVTVGVGAVITGSVWAIRRFRDRSAAKVAARDLVTAHESAPPQDDGLERSQRPA